MEHTETGPDENSDRPLNDELSIGTDRDVLVHLILTSPASGNRMHITSGIEDIGGETVFEVGTMNDRRKVFVRMEEINKKVEE
jgi:hypothetical protein